MKIRNFKDIFAQTKQFLKRSILTYLKYTHFCASIPRVKQSQNLFRDLLNIQNGMQPACAANFLRQIICYASFNRFSYVFRNVVVSFFFIMHTATFFCHASIAKALKNIMTQTMFQRHSTLEEILKPVRFVRFSSNKIPKISTSLWTEKVVVKK